MVTIKLPDVETQDEAIGFMLTEVPGFKCRLYRSGEVVMPEEALAALANESFSFTVIGKATHNQIAALRRELSH